MTCVAKYLAASSNLLSLPAFEESFWATSRSHPSCLSAVIFVPSAVVTLCLAY